jgi:hypothetical protein
MDDADKAYFDGVMVQVNTKLDDILDKLEAMRLDHHSVRGQMLFIGQDSLTLSQRITKLEQQMRELKP